MTEQTSHAGHFVWHDLMSLDAAKARDFYVKLLGWRTSEMRSPQGSITVFSVGEKEHADVVPLDASQDIPSHWMCYVSVDDADEAARRAETLGGKLAMPAFDTPYGRIAVLQDPAGAWIQAIAMPGAPSAASTWPPAHGAFCWYELMVPDPDAVTPFYEQVFGWRRDVAMDMGTPGPYYLFKRGEDMAAGMMKLPPEVPVSNWLAYIAVDDVDASTRQAEELGASVMMPARDVPGTGRFSVIKDPTGAVVALFTAAPMP